MTRPAEHAPDDAPAPAADADAASAVQPLLQRGLAAQVVTLAFWPFLQQLLAWLVSFIDTAVAGRLSVEATNAIAIAAYFGWFLVLMTSAAGSGAAALIARAIGGGDRRLGNRALGQAILLAVGWSAAVGAAVFLGADAIGRLAQLDEASRVLATQYLRVIAAAAPLTAVLFIGNACLTAAGDTRTPFFAMVAFNAANILLTLYLALGPWSFTLAGTEWAVPGRGLGVLGIAWGTAGGTAVGAALILAVLLRPGLLQLRWRRLAPRRELLRRIVRIAIPSVGEGLGHWLGNFAIIVLVGWIARDLGEDAYQGAHIVAIRIEALSFLPAMALAAAASTLTGQFLGAGDRARAKRAAIACWLAGAGAMTLLGVAFVAVPGFFVRLVTDQPELLELSPRLVRICGFVQFGFGSSIILGAAMRGAGDTRTPMLLTNALTWGFRLPACAFFGWYLGWGLVGVWYGLCGELALRGAAFIAFFFKGRWERVEV
ncbi:MATE family efflux transporter [Phycisphaera mikurensis]|uniref:Multidrug-efflux transporter n=1 Tax=Phycisphaera mikurensis (strain NBRC 102666 / KCTC 22515 / FYK2301M01) TaxID=1142394 RepID=I0IB52_PHYMF|nr:MATE family efflux transporter [Phycisphaera mikurensis]MBB6442991.1 putative MATE family efflux protein [Phycisphaera mikurensis]BAM02490.1 putative MatE family transporter [Phycisphaera mikurensis NBRC 102666]